MPNHYAGDLLHTLAVSRLSRVRTELFQLRVVPMVARDQRRGHSSQQTAQSGYGFGRGTFQAGVGS